MIVRRHRPPTLGDVAKCAGVSLQTVSAVLNRSRSNTRVSAATRTRIVEAAARLNYHPNAMARALLHRRTHTVGVLFGVVGPDVVVTNPYASEILQGTLTAAAERGFCVTIFTTPWRDDPRAAAAYRDGRTDGILVVAPPAESSVVGDLAALGIALTVVSSPGEPFGVPSVDVDNYLGARMATEYLIELGHSRISHVTGNANMMSVATRKEGFLSTLKDAGITIRSDYVVAARYDGETVQQAVRGLLGLPEPPTAIFAGNDTIALVAMKTAQELGVSIPSQLSIVGFDDAPTSSLVTPQLSSVRQPLQEISATATRLLIAQIEGETVEPISRLMAPELIRRASTAPCRAHWA